MGDGARFETLLDIMARLRGAEGCPWDQEQTHESLRPYLLEEAYEVLDALESDDFEDFSEELGDLLLQVVFHAQIASEDGRFDIGQILDRITEKLIRRHPHVFEGARVADAGEVVSRWHEIKQGEKEGSSALSGVPGALPALYRSYALQKKARRVGFDWVELEDVVSKVHEELEELMKCLEAPARDRDRVAFELGDVLFAVVNLGRHLEVNPEVALRDASERFRDRFQAMEKLADDREKDLREFTLDELEELWQEAKSALE